MDLRWNDISKVKIVAVVVGLAVLVALWTVDVSDTVMAAISAAWVIGLFGWAWVTGQRRQRDGYIDNLDNSAYSYSWRDRSPSIGRRGGYRYADSGGGDSGDSGGGDSGGGDGGGGDGGDGGGGGGGD